MIDQIRQLRANAAYTRHAVGVVSRLGPQAGLLVTYPRLFRRLPSIGRPTHERLRTIRIKGYPHPFTIRVDTSDIPVLRQVFSDDQYGFSIEGDVRLIIDCGANIGAAACYLLHRHPKAFLIAIEPDPDNAAVCEKNLAPFQQRVRFIQAAVWSRPCGLKIVRGEYGDGLEWATQVRHTHSGEQPDVPAMTLDEILDASGHQQIDLLKMDIEAAELEVFGAEHVGWLARTRNLAVELHGRQCEENFWQRMRPYYFDCSSRGELTICKNIQARPSPRRSPDTTARFTTRMPGTADESRDKGGHLGVSIVVCCHNSIARLGPTLDHLALQCVPSDLPWEVIVVDNASTDGTAAFARAHWPIGAPAPLRVVEEFRLGLSAARECGFTHARYGVVAFVDDDNWVCPSWVVEADRVFREHPDVAVCGGDSEAVFESAAPWWFERFAMYFAVGRLKERAGELTDTRGAVFGAGMCVRAAAWADLKSRNFRFWLTGRVGASLTTGEDCELCFGLRLIGWRIWYEPRLQLKHFLPSTRLHWKYVLRLARGVGAAATFLAAYYAMLDAQQHHPPRRPPSWLGGIGRQLTLLTRHPLKLLLPRFVPHGDIVQFNQNLYLGHLLALLEHRELLREQWAGLSAAGDRTVGNFSSQRETTTA